MVAETAEIVVERWANMGEARRKRRFDGRRCRRRVAIVSGRKRRSVATD